MAKKWNEELGDYSISTRTQQIFHWKKLKLTFETMKTNIS